MILNKLGSGIYVKYRQCCSVFVLEFFVPPESILASNLFFAIIHYSSYYYCVTFHKLSEVGVVFAALL